MKKTISFLLIAVILAVGISLPYAAIAADSPETIWQIGEFGNGRAEFNHTAFAGIDEVTFSSVPDASAFPAFLYVSGYTGGWEVAGVNNVTIGFTVAKHYGEVNLTYGKYGGETDVISIDGIAIATVTGPGEDEGEIFNISVGPLHPGTHTLTIECTGVGDGEGAHTLDALKLSGVHTVSTVTLYAGQTIPVGNVTVWDDCTNLYVTYQTEDGWEMSETHLATQGNVTDIPQTKAKTGSPLGNPIPGHFGNQTDHDPLVTEVTYTIPLSKFGCNDTIDIAAHAAVQKVITAAPYYASYVVEAEQGLLRNGNSVRVQRSDPNAALAWETDRDETNFFSLGFGGNITVEFDCPIRNGEGNDVKIVEDTWGSYPLETANVSASQDGLEWVHLGVANNLQRDPIYNIHTISEFDLGSLAWAKFIKVEDTSDPSLFDSRPTADAFDLNAVVSLQDCIQEETAWADGDRFNEKGNWATYFSYVLDCPELCPE